MKPPGGSDAWVPWAFGAGFGAFLLGGVVMSVIAIRSDPGLVAGAPQRLAGSDILPVGRAPVLELRVSARSAAGVLVEARVRGPDGQPAMAEAVTGTLRRATHSRHDRPLVFEATGGVWRALVAPPDDGIWDIAVEARSAGAVANGSLRL